MKDRINEAIKLTNHVTYLIIDNIIYLFLDDYVSYENIKSIYNKIYLFVKDKDIDYINFCARNMSCKKEMYKDLELMFLVYDVNKLNILFNGIKNKIEYKCYGLISKRHFMEMIKMKDSNVKENVNSSNKGFVNNMLLLFVGLAMLCFFSIEAAVYLVN